MSMRQPSIRQKLTRKLSATLRPLTMRKANTALIQLAIKGPEMVHVKQFKI